MTTSRPAAVIVLAAGEGTRMKSATPKVLHAIGGRTLLGHAIAAARGTSPQHLAVVIRHGRDLVAAHIATVDADAVTPALHAKHICNRPPPPAVSARARPRGRGFRTRK